MPRPHQIIPDPTGEIRPCPCCAQQVRKHCLLSIYPGNELILIDTETFPSCGDPHGPVLAKLNPRVVPYPTESQPKRGLFTTVPELGADIVRVFRVSQGAMALNQLTEQPPLQLHSGSGPRHGTFVETRGGMLFYVINQIVNILVTFSVSYLRNGSLAVKALAEMDLLVRVNGTMVDRDVKASHLQALVRTFFPSASGALVIHIKSLT
jgi:6-phosphogluconolactonase (cycloisomerase 2 family)